MWVGAPLRRARDGLFKQDSDEILDHIDEAVST